jgi:hypothetical protein
VFADCITQCMECVEWMDWRNVYSLGSCGLLVSVGESSLERKCGSEVGRGWEEGERGKGISQINE